MTKEKSVTTPRRYRTYTASALLVLSFVVFAVMAALGGMGTTEQAVFDYIYTMPNSLEGFAKVVTQLGSAWFAIGMIGLLLVVKWDPRPALVLARNSIVAYVSVVVLKFIVGRPRPVLILQDFTARSVVAVGDGFPSGHTAMATVVSLTLLSYLPRSLRWIPVVWILLVGWSRVYLGVHAPLDVVGGFIVGLLVMLLADFIPLPVSKKR